MACKQALRPLGTNAVPHCGNHINNIEPPLYDPAHHSDSKAIVILVQLEFDSYSSSHIHLSNPRCSLPITSQIPQHLGWHVQRRFDEPHHFWPPDNEPPLYARPSFPHSIDVNLDPTTERRYLPAILPVVSNLSCTLRPI